MKIVKMLGEIDRQLPKEKITELAFDDSSAIIHAGNYDLLKVYIELKRYEHYLAGLIDNIKEEALKKALSENKKSFEYAHTKVSIQTRTTYDFSKDKKWSFLKINFETYKTEIKEREELMKTAFTKGKLEVIDRETGEVEEILPPDVLERKAALLIKFDGS